MHEASLRKPLFGKEAEIVIWGVDEMLASGMLMDAYERGRELEKIFNFYDKKSTLSTLNQKRRLEVPEELLYVMKEALELCKKTGGRYDISLGKQFVDRKKGREINKLGCSYKDIHIEGDTVELTHPDVMIDLGSIAKGYIADEMTASLESEGVLSALVDARGDIRLIGKNVMGVQDPRGEGILRTIEVADCGVATSGDYNQFDKTYEKPHILNKGDYFSVTTVADRLMEADGYATAIFVTPREEVAGLLRGSGIKAMCVGKDFIDYFNGFERLIV